MGDGIAEELPPLFSFPSPPRHNPRRCRLRHPPVRPRIAAAPHQRRAGPGRAGPCHTWTSPSPPPPPIQKRQSELEARRRRSAVRAAEHPRGAEPEPSRTPRMGAAPGHAPLAARLGRAAAGGRGKVAAGEAGECLRLPRGAAPFPAGIAPGIPEGCALCGAALAAPRTQVRSFQALTFRAPPPALAARAVAARAGGAGAPGILRALGILRARVPPGVSAGGRGLRAGGSGERSGVAAAARALPSR